MLNAIRFVAPIGGEWAFDALTACRNVHPAPQVVPSVSAVDVTVNVIAGVGVGVGSAESDPPLYAFTSGHVANRFWPNPTSATETPVKMNSRPRKIRGTRNADWELRFFFMVKSLPRFSSAILLPEIRGEVPEIFQDNRFVL
jgi:hypothetical protein